VVEVGGRNGGAWKRSGEGCECETIVFILVCKCKGGVYWWKSLETMSVGWWCLRWRKRGRV